MICICFVLLAVVLTDGFLSPNFEIEFSLLSADELNFAHLSVSSENKMTLVENGTTNFDIVISDDCDQSLLDSAQVLQEVVLKMSGASLDIVNHTEGKGIYIDEVAQIDVSSVENDGFILEISDDAIKIQGVHYGGSRNGVYHFADEYLGAVFVESKDTYVPSHQSVYLEKGVFLHNPAVVGREVYYYDFFDSSYSDKLRLNVSYMPENSATPLSTKEIGNDCHSMYQYLSPEEYFATHPEYFSLKGGKRIYQYNGISANLCLSNEDVYNIVEASLAKKIKENPSIKVWDFSINDNWAVKGCECSHCSKLDREAGGTGMGSLLPFVNRLAKRFPEISIKTLAYFHTEIPPTNLEVEENVIITLCAMRGDQACSYLNPTCTNAHKFHELVEKWTAVTDNVVIWDYVIDFKHQLLPFPNLAVQQENQEFYEQNNVRGVFHQGSRDRGNELSEIRQYVLAKLLWKGKDMDVDKEVSRYVQAYYGDAAPYVLDYLNKSHRELAEGSDTLGLYDSPSSHSYSYLSSKNLKDYEHIMNDALSAVEGDEKYTYRVEGLQVCVLYAKLIHHSTPNNERLVVKEKIDRICLSHNIEVLHEFADYDFFDQNWKSFALTEELLFALPYAIFTLIVLTALLCFALMFAKRTKKAYIKVKNLVENTKHNDLIITKFELHSYILVSKKKDEHYFGAKQFYALPGNANAILNQTKPKSFLQ